MIVASLALFLQVEHQPYIILASLSAYIQDSRKLTWVSPAFATHVRWLQGHTSFVTAVLSHLTFTCPYTVCALLLMWNLENGQPIGSPLQHPSTVNRVSFSTDGILLATGCSDSSAYTWDVSAIIKEAGLNELLVSCSFLSLPVYKLNSRS